MRRLDVLKTSMIERQRAQSMAARAGGAAVTTKKTIEAAVAAKSAHAAFNPYVAASSSSDEQDGSKSWKECLVAAASARLSRKMGKPWKRQSTRRPQLRLAPVINRQSVHEEARCEKKQRHRLDRQHELREVATLKFRQERETAAHIRRSPSGRGFGRLVGAGVAFEVDPCSKGRCHAAL